MNTQWLQVDDWLDLLGNAWIGLVLIAVAVVPSIYAARNNKTSEAVLAQVQNAHGTNLRDDIDRAIAAVETLAHDVRGLRSDLMAEEDHRRADRETVRQQIADLRQELEHRTSKFRR